MRVVVLDTGTQSRLDEIEAAKIAVDASSKACIDYLRSTGQWSADLEEMARADMQRYLVAFESCGRADQRNGGQSRA